MNVVEIKGSREAPRAERSSMETLIITTEQVAQWRIPPCQRPLRVNEKVHKLADRLGVGETICLPGVITLGKIGRASDLYIVNGQHRLEAFKLSGQPEIIADVRIVHFDSMADLAMEFVEENSALVRMRPDDVLRGLEPVSKAMQRIVSECPYVGYDQVRRGGTTSPVLGMSQLLRAWMGSSAETPVGWATGRTAAQIAMDLGPDDTDALVRFLHLAYAAWGREPDYYRLWSTLNLVMSMWLYRRLVLDKVRGVKRYVALTDNQFKQCLMALSADRQYCDFLQGRQMSERDRSPTYTHLKRIFAKRLQAEGFERPLMPNAAWYGG